MWQHRCTGACTATCSGSVQAIDRELFKRHTSTNHLIDVCMHALGNSTTPGLQFDFNLTPPVVRKREHAQADPPRARPIPETGRNS